MRGNKEPAGNPPALSCFAEATQEPATEGKKRGAFLILRNKHELLKFKYQKLRDVRDG